jgi:hypothetical protein
MKMKWGKEAQRSYVTGHTANLIVSTKSQVTIVG